MGNLRLWLTLASRGGLIVDGLRLCLILVHPEYRQLSLVAVRASYLINRRDSAAQASPPPPVVRGGKTFPEIIARGTFR